MNPLHLIWIVPLSAAIGYFIAILMATAKRADEEIMSNLNNNTTFNQKA